MSANENMREFELRKPNLAGRRKKRALSGGIVPDHRQ